MGIFRRGMAKTRQSFFGRIAQLLGNTEIDEDTWEDVETLLIQSDMGVDTTGIIVEYLQDYVRESGITRTDELQQVLKRSLTGLLRPPPPLDISGRELSVILIVGVNGSGKTTSIAKLANRLKRNQRRVMIAAGDTFRAAAIEQLQKWGERIDVPVIAGKQGADPASVVFDATNAARARNYDVLIVDTAGRLHSNYNLMQELAKINAVIGKAVPGAPHEVLLVLDGTTGQNALRQAEEFRRAVGVTGLIVTKLDGTAKGGVVFSIFQDLELPVHYIGLGEGIDDLVLFNAENFVDSLFEES